MSAAPVRIVDYDPSWPVAFAALASVIKHQLGSWIMDIEHVGSTAVPGLAAKPIIDMDVVIAAESDLPAVIALLGSLGYIYEGDLGISGRYAFARANDEVPEDGAGTIWPEHHLYVCPADSPELARHLAFRDYLRTHPVAAVAYGKLKRRLAAEHTWNRDAYTEGKSDFINTILQKVNHEEG